MNWINRSAGPIFKRRRLAAALALALAAPSVAGQAGAAAPTTIDAVYANQPIGFSRLSSSRGATTVALDDPGLAALLRAMGATMTWQPGGRYIMISTPAPVVIAFAVGDRRYDVGQIALQAQVAPYQQGDEVYLPLRELLSALGLALLRDGSTMVLQPQLTSLDVRAAGNRVDLVARGGAPLRPRRVAQSDASIAYAFDGVGTSLTGTRDIRSGGVRSVSVVQQGGVRDPRTIVTVALQPGALHDVPHSDDGRDAVLSFASSMPAAQSPAQFPAAGQPAGAQGGQPASAGGTSVTGVTIAPSAAGYTIAVAVSGDANFAWHRLRDPDNRFWIDLQGAQLGVGPIDRAEPSPIGALRVRQVDPSTVRVALSLDGPKALTVTPSAGGVTIEVGRDDVADASAMVRAGNGSLGSVVASGQAAAPVTPAPENVNAAPNAPSGWKFGGAPAGGRAYVARNPRLIVIDPGHGGSDRGSSRHGVDEASLTLDMSKRLRDILVARGWQVRMTHDTDVDVYAPNDSAHDELQARDDVANNAGAAMFVSIHVNAFFNAGPSGTTTYYSKPSDVPLGQMIEGQLTSDGTKDDGLIKAHYYVTLHAMMPAVLVETAFISNPDDFALLTSPAWRQKVAVAIADGIDQYSRRYPASGGAQ